MSRVLVETVPEETRKKVLARNLTAKQINITAIVTASSEGPFQSYVWERIICALQATGLFFITEPEKEVDEVLPLAV